MQYEGYYTMNITNKQKREKVLAIVTAIVIAAVLVFTIIIEPQLNNRGHRIEKLQQLKLKLVKMQGDILVKDRIEQLYSQIEALITTQRSEQEQISVFTRELSSIYSKLDIKIRSVKILPIINNTFHKSLLIRIEMTGYIKDFLKFILSIETHTSPLKIEQFDLKSQETRDQIRASLLVSKVVGNGKV
jgi:Tfp pilus assembly protein PilO